MDCSHKYMNGTTALIFDKNYMDMEYPRKYHVRCILCEESMVLKKLPPELLRELREGTGAKK